MRPVDIPLAGPLLDQERTGIVLHDLDGNAVAEAAHPGAVCKRDRDGTRDLRGRSSFEVLFRRQRARSYTGPIGNAGGRPAESERLGSDEAGPDVTLASAPYSATGTERELPREVASLTGRRLKLGRFPHSLAASLAALPSMSLFPKPHLPCG